MVDKAFLESLGWKPEEGSTSSNTQASPDVVPCTMPLSFGTPEATVGLQSPANMGLDDSQPGVVNVGVIAPPKDTIVEYDDETHAAENSERSALSESKSCADVEMTCVSHKVHSQI